MDDKLISIQTGVGNVGRGDRRSRRSNCIFPSPTIRFDVQDRRVVAAWSWFGVAVLNVGTGVRIKVMPSLLLVPLSCN